MKTIVYVIILMLCYACKNSSIDERLIVEQKRAHERVMQNFTLEFQQEYNRFKDTHIGESKVLNLVFEYQKSYLVLLDKIDQKEDFTLEYQRYKTTMEMLSDIYLSYYPQNELPDGSTMYKVERDRPFYLQQREEEEKLFQELINDQTNDFKTYQFKNILINNTINIVTKGCHREGISDCLCIGSPYVHANASHYQEGDTIFLKKVLINNTFPIMPKVYVNDSLLSEIEMPKSYYDYQYNTIVTNNTVLNITYSYLYKDFRDTTISIQYPIKRRK